MADRRTLLLMLVAGGAVIGGFRVLPSLFEGLPELEPLDDPPGFRRVAGGSVSSGFNPFAGLSVGGSEETPARVSPDSLRADLCSHLFGTAARSEGVVPIASFADYYCPYCRVQTKRLSELGSELGSEVAIEWHELPLLGETSILAARAALAAKRQDAYVAFHESLLTSPFRANAEYLSLLSERIGVDHDRLIADMESESVSRELEISASLSRLFAFVGTPAMVVGRTVIQGEISDRTLRRIISLEREEGWPSVC